jgi:very-short-patch-repair endonuclease
MFAIEDPNKINEGGLQTYYLKIGKYQCPKCQCEGEQKEFLKKAIARHGDKYLYDKVDFCDPNSIVNGKRKVLIGCKVKGPNGREHGYFFQNPYNHQGRGQGCPICRESKGEIYVNSVLISKYGSKYKILREKDATFEKLVGKKLPLPFDFYIPEKKVLIEYDGEGHFEPTYGSSDARRSETYNNTFQNDNIKNNWIKSKKNNPDGISLIRIPYTMEFKDIDKLLVQRIRNIQPNTIYYLGEYPRRSARKEIISKFKINETKLSLMNTYKEIN